MEVIHDIFGEGKDLNSLQTASRAFVVFFITLALIRVAGMRTFGLKSAFDNVIVIMLGAVMSRPVVGASPFFPTVIAGLIIALVHRLLAWLSLHSKTVSQVVRGNLYNLYRDGQFDKGNLNKCNLTVEEVMGEMRTSMHTENLGQVREIYMEANGKISIVKNEA